MIHPKLRRLYECVRPVDRPHSEKHTANGPILAEVSRRTTHGPAPPTAKPRAESPQSEAGRETELRIIGGHFRGRKLRYHGDPIVRPMKHRVREAIFNLISTESAGHHVIDLFAGTGALGSKR